MHRVKKLVVTLSVTVMLCGWACGAEGTGVIDHYRNYQRRARELAAEFATSAPLAVRAVKRALARSENVSLEDQLSFEAQQQAACFETEDVAEGLSAAREKRSPKFQGR